METSNRLESDIPSELVREAVLDTIEKKTKTKNYRVNVSSASKAGEDNFIGIIHRILFDYNEIDTKEKKSSSLIVKVAPQNLIRRSQFYTRPAFMREIYTYKTILPTLRQFEQSKGIDVFNQYPECYRIVDVDINEGLIFEDMEIRGFATLNRHTEEVSADHVHLVMQTLGKLHAISFALRDQQPEKFNELTSKLSEVFVVRSDDNLRTYFTQQAETTFEAISSEEDAHLLAKLKQFYTKDAIDIAADCLDLELIGSASVITHGDSWQNNVMFKYNAERKPIDIIFLDWQTTRCASPIIDIVYFMFCCTTKEVRDTHYDSFLKVYHNSLASHIRRLGSDPDKLFPFHRMLDHFRKFAKFGLVLSTLLLPMITSDSGKGIDMDSTIDCPPQSNDFISDNSQIKLNKRLRDVVIDMINLKYI